MENSLTISLTLMKRATDRMREIISWFPASQFNIYFVGAADIWCTRNGYDIRIFVDGTALVFHGDKSLCMRFKTKANIFNQILEFLS